MKRRPLLIALAGAGPAALCAGAIWAWRRAPRAPAPEAAATAGPVAALGAEAGAEAVSYLFSLSLDDADGAHRTLSAWRGKTLIVNFWATWCAPCVEEMPQLQKLSDQMRASNVAVIGIGVDDADKIQQFRRQHAIRFDLLVAGLDGMDLARRLGNPQPVLPYTVLIRPDGRIAEQYSGRIRESELRREVGAPASD